MPHSSGPLVLAWVPWVMGGVMGVAAGLEALAAGTDWHAIVHGLDTALILGCYAFIYVETRTYRGMLQRIERGVAVLNGKAGRHGR